MKISYYTVLLLKLDESLLFADISVRLECLKYPAVLLESMKIELFPVWRIRRMKLNVHNRFAVPRLLKKFHKILKEKH